MTDIIKQGAQILSPSEYEKMRGEMNTKNRLLFDGLLFTGMRIEEFFRFLAYPEWFHPDRQYVELPVGASLKKKAKMKERQVLLSNIGTRAIRDLVSALNKGETGRINRVTLHGNFKSAANRAGLNPRGITPKMCRKTWISWLMVTYPEDGLRVAASSGHDTSTLIRHYLTLPFSTSEREQIRTYVSGWGGRA